MIGLSAELRDALLETLAMASTRRSRAAHHVLEPWRGRITGFSAENSWDSVASMILDRCDRSGTIICGEKYPLLATIRDRQQREARLLTCATRTGTASP